MRPVFADPKTDLVFRRIFGTKARKRLLIALLNDLLGLSGAHCIVDLEYLPGELVPPVDGRKLSIVDVKCTDKSGVRYIVEMQVLNVEGFEKRLVYNLCKAYAGQLGSGEEYPRLNDVVAVAICDFDLWPEQGSDGRYEIPMLSRWHMTEEQTKAKRLGQMRYVVLELPKYQAGPRPKTMVDRWAYFFREAEKLKKVPKELADGPIAEALEVARASHFSAEEWEAYDRAKMAEQDARGALTQAEKGGFQQGLEHGLRGTVRSLAEILGLSITPRRAQTLEQMGVQQLSVLVEALKKQRRWP